jgi:hypothetical protein
MIQFGLTVSIPIAPLHVPETVWFMTEQARDDFIKICDANKLPIIWVGLNTSYSSAYDAFIALQTTFHKAGFNLKTNLNPKKES